MLLYALSIIGILSVVTLVAYPSITQVLQQTERTFYPAACENTFKTICLECHRHIILSLLLGSFVAIIFGYLIARNGLKKINDFNKHIENMSAHSLQEKIYTQDWPKELRTLGEQFNRMLDRIQRSFNTLSQFTSDIAHELRTPLHNLKGMAELSLGSEKSSEEYQNTFAFCINEYDHLTKLIESLLFLARSDHNAVSLEKEFFSIHDEMISLLDYHAALAQDKSISFHTENLNPSDRLKADLTLFKRVLCNLLSNALRYTPNHGHIFISSTQSADWSIITLADTGCGIEESQLQKVFERFHRVDPSRSENTGGIGLGLAIVQSIMKLHQGHLTIHSQLGAGTTIKLHFPSI